MTKALIEKTIDELCNVEYGTRVVRKRDAGTIYPVYGGGGETFFLDSYNREDRVVIARFAMSEKCTRRVGGKFALNDSGLTLSPKDPNILRQDYLDYCALSLNDRIYESARGTAQKNLDVPAFRRMILAYPPSLEKQREVVEKLDSAFAEIDLLEQIHAKRNEDLLDHLFDTFRDALLISSSGDNSSVEFGEIGNFVRGPFGGSLKKSIFKKSGIAVYEQQHAIYDRFDSFRYFIDENKYQEMKRFEVKANDLIMSCSGTYGKIAVVPEGSPKGIINQALLKITPAEGVKSTFIKHWMQSGLFQSELEKEVGGAALQNVPSVAKMKAIKIRLPEEGVQTEILEKLERVEELINKVKSIQTQIKGNYVDLRQSLLSSAFTQEEAVA